jgi:hypothetical protein
VIEIGRGSGVTRVSHGGRAWPTPDGPDQVGDVFVAASIRTECSSLGRTIRLVPDGLACRGRRSSHLLAAATRQSEAKMTQILSP